MPRYAIDTNCFVDLYELGFSEGERERVWDGLMSLIQQQRLFTVDVVIDELERHELADCLDRLHPYRRSGFVVRKRELLRQATTVRQLRRVISQFPRMSRWSREHDAADPYLVALAWERELTVVCQEGKFSGKNTADERRKKSGQIPDACRLLQVACIPLAVLLVREKLA